MNIYEKVEVLENERFKLRKTDKEDAGDLLKVYSDIKSVPFFNGDNCHGDDFHYSTIEKMNSAIDFWLYSYDNKYFVRWTIIDKINMTAIGTIEGFHRHSSDFYNNYCVLRLDLRSDYEKEDNIISILELITDRFFDYFCSSKLMTKGFPSSKERINALSNLNFHRSIQPMIGSSDNKEYYDYWIIER